MRLPGSARVVLVCAALALDARAADDPAAKEFAALDEAYQSRPFEEKHDADKKTAERFAAGFDAFARKHAGTDEAVEAKVRLIELSWRLDDREKSRAECGRLAREIVAEAPKSTRLDGLLAHWAYLGPEDLRAVQDAMGRPDAPDSAKAGLLRYSALVARGQSNWDDEAKDLRELQAKYPDVPCAGSTYGALAKATLERAADEAWTVGRRAPEIAGDALDGKPFKLSALKGRVVVVLFDRYVRGENMLTYFPALHGVLSPKVAVVWVSREWSPLRARAAVKQDQMTWTVLHDGPDGPIWSRCNPRVNPPLFVIDADGVVQAAGVQKPADLEPEVRRVLGLPKAKK